MAAASIEFKGGDDLRRELKRIAYALGRQVDLRVGFLENARYPENEGGLHVAQVAFWNEFGTIRAPARPFFRNTIRQHSGEWGSDLAKMVKAVGYDSVKALRLLGTLIKDQLVTSIQQWPADNAPSTVRRKGFNKGLVDTGFMQDSPDYEVVRK